MERLPSLAKNAGLDPGSGLSPFVGGRANNGEPCLRFSVRGSVQLVCQRCLDPLPVPISDRRQLSSLESLRGISEADDEIDRVLASRHMDVGQLVED